MSSLTKICVLISLSFCLVSCASTNFENIEEAKSFDYVENEKNLWKTVEDIQQKLIKSDAIYADDDLHEYVNTVLDGMIGESEEKLGADIVAYILYDSDFNAGMYPNGFMVVHTGLLANIDNEAQLAIVLGHELTHYLHRHGLKGQNKAINIRAALNTIRVAAVGASYGLAYSGYDPTAIGAIHDTIALGLASTFYGHSRSQETDADAYGFELLKESGYDPKESKKAFENMYNALELIDKKSLIPYFYQSHPKTKSRIKNFDKYISNLSKEPSENLSVRTGEKEYLNKIKDMLLDNLELDLKKNRVKLAKRQLDKYKESFSEDYKSLYFQALILIREDENEEAINKLVESKNLYSDYPNVLKELGLQFYKKGEKDKANVNFQEYLKLQPNAIDAEFIRGYINE